jgi:hypothetical protein
MEQYGEMPGLGVAAPETGPNGTAEGSTPGYHSLRDPLTCTCPRCTAWRENVRDRAYAARHRRTKRHSLIELSQALASGEGPASIYELLRRCGA